MNASCHDHALGLETVLNVRQREGPSTIPVLRLLLLERDFILRLSKVVAQGLQFFTDGQLSSMHAVQQLDGCRIHMDTLSMLTYALAVACSTTWEAVISPAEEQQQRTKVSGQLLPHSNTVRGELDRGSVGTQNRGFLLNLWMCTHTPHACMQACRVLDASCSAPCMMLRFVLTAQQLCSLYHLQSVSLSLHVLVVTAPVSTALVPYC